MNIMILFAAIGLLAVVLFIGFLFFILYMILVENCSMCGRYVFIIHRFGFERLCGPCYNRARLIHQEVEEYANRAK